jgi:hypothetical protein
MSKLSENNKDLTTVTPLGVTHAGYAIPSTNYVAPLKPVLPHQAYQIYAEAQQAQIQQDPYTSAQMTHPAIMNHGVQSTATAARREESRGLCPPPPVKPKKPEVYEGDDEFDSADEGAETLISTYTDEQGNINAKMMQLILKLQAKARRRKPKTADEYPDDISNKEKNTSNSYQSQWDFAHNVKQ